MGSSLCRVRLHLLQTARCMDTASAWTENRLPRGLLRSWLTLILGEKRWNLAGQSSEWRLLQACNVAHCLPVLLPLKPQS